MPTDDLSATITHLNRVRPSSRARLANSELTRAFLVSAERLLEDHFVSRGSAGEEAAFPGFLSRPRVVARTAQDFPEAEPTEAKFRDRWLAHQDFLKDIVAFTTSNSLNRLRAAMEEAEASLPMGSSLEDAATALARTWCDTRVQLPSTRLRLLAAASLEPSSEEESGPEDQSVLLRDILIRLCRAEGVRQIKDAALDRAAEVLSVLSDGLVVKAFLGRPGDGAEEFGTVLAGIVRTLRSGLDGVHDVPVAGAVWPHRD